MISRSGSGMTAVAPTVRSGRAAPATFLPALVLAFHVSSTPMMLPVASAAFVGRTPAMIASSSFSCKFKFGTCTKIRSGANDYYQYPSTNNSDEVSSPPMSKDQYPSDICDEECQEGYERIENALRDAEEELTKVTERILRDEALVGPNGYDKNIDDDDGGLTKAEVEIIEAEFLAAEADRIKAQAEFKRIRSNYQQREVKRAEGDANNEADLIQRIEERNRLARERLEAQQAKQVEKELDSVVKGKIKTEAEIGKETEVEVKAEVAAEEKETSVGTIGVDEFRTLRERLDYERLLDSDLSTHQRYLMRELGEEMGGSGGNTEGRAGTGSFGMIPVVKTSRKK